MPTSIAAAIAINEVMEGVAWLRSTCERNGNLGGVRVSVLFQRVITYAFLAVMVSLIIAGLKFGKLENLQPAFSPPGGKSWLLGFTWLFGTCAMLLYGFQSALYLIEERVPPPTCRCAPPPAAW